jgi:hypothetical protein
MVIIARIIGILALAVAQVVSAQVQGREAEVPLGLSQKQVFARGMLEDAALTKRIQASAVVEAQGLLKTAGESYSAALAAIKAGDFSAADKQLNQTLSALGRARRLVPDVAAIESRQLADYQKILESVESLQKSYLSYFKRAKPAAGTPENAQDELAKLGIAGLKDNAGLQLKQGHPTEAIAALEKAEGALKLALGRLLGAILIEYPRNSETLPEQYAFELERNRSYLDLIPVAINELKPTEDVKQTIDNLVEQDHAAIDLAAEYENLRDYAKALANVRVATSYLELALNAAGLVISRVRNQGME